MKIVFLASTRGDLDWLRHYYERIFPEGSTLARRHYRTALANLRNNPHIGHPAEECGNRELVIARTPFVVEYRIVDDRIEILRVRDGRANRLATRAEE